MRTERPERVAHRRKEKQQHQCIKGCLFIDLSCVRRITPICIMYTCSSEEKPTSGSNTKGKRRDTSSDAVILSQFRAPPGHTLFPHSGHRRSWPPSSGAHRSRRGHPHSGHLGASTFRGRLVCLDWQRGLSSGGPFPHISMAIKDVGLVPLQEFPLSFGSS